MTFQEKLDLIVKKNDSLICIGLDTDLMKLPPLLNGTDHSIFEFNKAIIDATHDLICAYKPNTAFYEAYGVTGILQLKMTCDYIHQTYPEIPIIIDAKRGDIGSTNEGYVRFVFDYLGADAVTLHPYLGKEALKPFLDKKDKGIIILCRTSNPGSAEFQDLKINNESLYKVVAKKVTNDWNKNNNCLLVVGATYADEMKEIRKIVGDMTFLVPGVGAQGGDIEKTVKAGLNSHRGGIIISSSRAIIYASADQDFGQKARDETLKLKNAVNSYRY